MRRRFADAGVDLRLLCFNMSDQMTDEEFDDVFRMARALGARGAETRNCLQFCREAPAQPRVSQVRQCSLTVGPLQLAG